jgi:hypothetical protein
VPSGEGVVSEEVVQATEGCTEGLSMGETPGLGGAHGREGPLFSGEKSHLTAGETNIAPQAAGRMTGREVPGLGGAQGGTGAASRRGTMRRDCPPGLGMV